MLAELRQKRAQAVQRLENPELLGSADEEEAKTLAAIQEQSFDRCVEAKLKLEKEGKCRCCYVTCSKLFKGVDFLTKHMHLKHPEFSADVLLKDAEPFMKKRFDAEPMGARPLPPVEVETHGHTELKSVKEILDKYMAAVAAGGHAAIASARRDQNTANPRRHSGGDGQEFRKRGQDDRDRRASGGSAQHSNKQNGGQMQYMEPRSEDNFARKISSYIDVDAPKVMINCCFCLCWSVFDLFLLYWSRQLFPQFKSKYCATQQAPSGLPSVNTPVCITCYKCGILCGLPLVVSF